MNTSHKRIRPDSVSDDSDEEYAHITPLSSTYDLSRNPPHSKTTELVTTSRPRRSTANYDTQGKVGIIPQARVKKRRHTTTRDDKTTVARRQLRHQEQPRTTSLQILPSETARRPRDQPSAALAELAEVPGLLLASSNELRVEDPAQSTSTSMNNLTRHFSMPLLETSLSDIPNRVAGTLINHWRTWRGGPSPGRSMTMHEADTSNNQSPTVKPSTIQEEDEDGTPRHSNNLRSQQSGSATAGDVIASDAPTAADEDLSFSYVRADANDYSEDSFEDVYEGEQHLPRTRFDSPANDQQLRTVLEELPPPPQHGHPAARRPYQPYNVLPRNAIRREDSALVWDSRGRQDSSRVAFDNMSDPSFISYEKATRLGFSPLLLPKDEWKLCETLGGHEDLATHYITLDIEIKSLDIPRENCFLLVVDSSEIDIILGYYYLSQHEVFQKLVGELSSRPKAFAIISKKPTQEQIQVILARRDARAKEARETEARIEADAIARRLSQGLRTISRQGTSQSIPGSAGSATGMPGEEGVYGPTTATQMNNSFHPAIIQHQDEQLRRPTQMSITGSFDRSSTADSSLFRNSFDSSPTDSNNISPATTFRSTSTADSSFEMQSLTKKKKLPQRLGDRFKGKGNV